MFRSRGTRFVGAGLLLLTLFLFLPARSEDGGISCKEDADTLKTICILAPDEFQVVEGGLRNWANDTTLSRSRPNLNQATAPTLNVTGPLGNSKEEWALLQFPIDKLPRNATILQAFLVLQYRCEYYGDCSSGSDPTFLPRRDFKQRPLTAREVIVSWNESTITWNSFGPSSFNRTGVAGTSTGVLGGACAVDSNSFPSDPSVKCIDLSSSFQDYYEGRKENYGWVVRDENASCFSPSNEPCRQQFYSSGARSTTGSPKEDCPGIEFNVEKVEGITEATYMMSIQSSPNPSPCRPRLAVLLDRNAPIVQNVTIRMPPNSEVFYVKEEIRRGGRSGEKKEDPLNVTGRFPIELSLRVLDNRGRIRVLEMEVRDSKDTVVVPRFSLGSGALEFPIYNSRGELLGGVYRYTRLAPLNLTDGEYSLRFHIVDTDYNEVFWGSGVNIRVVSDLPIITNSVALPSSQISQFDPIEFKVRATSLHPGIPIRKVVGTIYSRRATTQPLETREFLKVPGDSDTWSLRFPSWSDPGNFTLRIEVRDLAGNVNTTEISFDVKDVVPPKVSNLTLRADTFVQGIYVTESGSPLEASVEVVDSSPVRVFLRFQSPVGLLLREMVQSGERFYHGVVRDIPVGNYTVSVQAIDADGNVGESAALAYRVEPGAPPVIEARSPPKGGFANRTPLVSFVVTDPTLVRSKIHASLSRNGGPFEEILPRFEGSERATIGTLVGVVFSHGDRVEVHVTASDAFDHSSSYRWNFTVDARPPTLSVLVGTPRLTLPNGYGVGRSTLFSLDSSDSESGVDRVLWRITPLGLPPPPFSTYRGPFFLPEGISSGLYLLQTESRDRVGNSRSAEVLLVVDLDPPEILLNTTPDGLLLTVRDSGVGLESVRFLHKEAEGFWLETPTPLTESRGQTWRVPFPPFPRGTLLGVRVEARDRLGLVSTLGSETSPYTLPIPNHPPSVDFQGPSDRSEVKGIVPLTWKVFDLDSDPLLVELEARPIVLEHGTILSRGASLSGSYSWDTTRTPDGLYTLRLRASDGFDTSLVSRTVIVNNTGRSVGPWALPQGRVEFLEPILLEATIYRPTSSASVSILREAEGRLVPYATLPLHDDGVAGDRAAHDGIWSALYTFREKGSFRSVLRIVTDDSGVLEIEGKEFVVSSTLTKVVERNSIWIAVGGVLVLLGVAFALVQLIRYGYV